MGNDPTKPFDSSKDNGMYIRTDKPFYFAGEEVTGIYSIYGVLKEIFTWILEQAISLVPLSIWRLRDMNLVNGLKQGLSMKMYLILTPHKEFRNKL